jgi:hypothetical protein
VLSGPDRGSPEASGRGRASRSLPRSVCERAPCCEVERLSRRRQEGAAATGAERRSVGPTGRGRDRHGRRVHTHAYARYLAASRSASPCTRVAIRAIQSRRTKRLTRAPTPSIGCAARRSARRPRGLVDRARRVTSKRLCGHGVVTARRGCGSNRAVRTGLNDTRRTHMCRSSAMSKNEAIRPRAAVGFGLRRGNRRRRRRYDGCPVTNCSASFVLQTRAPS